MQTPDLIYKIVSPTDWQKSLQQNELQLGTIDNEFIHFSTQDQLDHVLNVYWANQEYLLLAVDPSKLEGNLKFETNPGGNSKYYHLYNGCIPIEAISDVSLLLKQSP